MKNNIIFAAFIVLVVLLLLLLSGTKSPQIPKDTLHIDIQEEAECLPCHAEGAINARKETHPPKDQCFLCHKRARKAHKD
ncbi:MAG: hypothetical protein JSV21_00065 [Nitrospirota bacterium]|nr:MAG: hypothetical protein JSV21_00065 [Nitrospirota bacterium]